MQGEIENRITGKLPGLSFAVRKPSECTILKFFVPIISRNQTGRNATSNAFESYAVFLLCSDF